MDKILNYLGIARRSRHLIAGTDSVIKGLQSNKLNLIILANEASDSTKDKIIKKAYYYDVPVLEGYSIIDICNATGLKNPIVSAIDDLGLSKAILELKSRS